MFIEHFERTAIQLKEYQVFISNNSIESQSYDAAFAAATTANWKVGAHIHD